MKPKHLLPFFLLAFACGGGEQTKTESKTDSTSIETDTTAVKPNSGNPEKKDGNLFVHDTTQYSVSFLTTLKETHGEYKSVELHMDSLILDGNRKEAILLPNGLPMNVELVYEGHEKGTDTRMTIKRINYVSVEYKLETFADKKATFMVRGTADLEPTFYFGAEGMEENEKGETITLDNYNDATKNCPVELSLGSDDISLGRFIYACGSDAHDVNSPLLKRVK